MLRNIQLAYGRGTVNAGQAAAAVLVNGYRLSIGENSLATMAAWIAGHWPRVIAAEHGESFEQEVSL